MYNRGDGNREKVRSYYLPGNSPAPPLAHRAHGSTINMEEGLTNLTHLLFSARGSGAPEEGVPVEVKWPSLKRNTLFDMGHVTFTSTLLLLQRTTPTG